MPRTKNTHRTWDASDIMIGVGEAAWVEVTNSDLGDLRVGDKLLADLTLKKPQAGDYVVWEKSPGKFSIRVFDPGYEDEGVVFGVGVAVIRKFSRKKRRKSTSHIASLQAKLTKLERLPENEAVRFQLESEIYRLKRKAEADEWPDVIEGGAQ